MRTTWIIIISMLLVGGIMYFIAQKNDHPVIDNIISFGDTPDSVKKKTQLYAAYDPAQLYYRDSAWFTQDSLPLKSINPDSALNAFDQQHSSATFLIDYDHQYFYDIEISKPATGQPFGMHLQLKPADDGIMINGAINSQNGKFDFSGPMMQMYRKFSIAYNAKLPDSLKSADSTLMKAEKVITIIEK
ncbi:hypothetical protein HHL16_07195 [Pseudoflavitalea sp. G-6-1-2]|uniref:hypothetical protein n=1 Tax=Pseudoflavitalea sp. G-6-1-2 TaxID=2728841 RepID=UPI00146F41D0|nr:hypothetical protein [Pseudoflavitalea sp. G-6-1-2]NML20653.1 hypothetical protein [Pseudoflavitalea sp. G-6-1-2]